MKDEIDKLINEGNLKEQGDWLEAHEWTKKNGWILHAEDVVVQWEENKGTQYYEKGDQPFYEGSWWQKDCGDNYLTCFEEAIEALEYEWEQL